MTEVLSVKRGRLHPEEDFRGGRSSLSEGGGGGEEEAAWVRAFSRGGGPGVGSGSSRSRRKQLGLADWPLAVDAEAAEIRWLLKR